MTINTILVGVTTEGLLANFHQARTFVVISGNPLPRVDQYAEKKRALLVAKAGLGNQASNAVRELSGRLTFRLYGL